MARSRLHSKFNNFFFVDLKLAKCAHRLVEGFLVISKTQHGVPWFGRVTRTYNMITSNQTNK